MLWRPWCKQGTTHVHVYYVNVQLLQCLFSISLYYVIVVQLQKRPLPADDDCDGRVELARKLARYGVSIPEYEAAITEIDVPW